MPAKVVQKKAKKRTLPLAVKEWIRDVKAYREEQARKGKEITYKEAMMRLSADRKGKKGTGKVKNMDMTTMKGRYRALIDKATINLRRMSDKQIIKFPARTIVDGFDFYEGTKITKTATENTLLQSLIDNEVYEYVADLSVNPPFEFLKNNGFGTDVEKKIRKIKKADKQLKRDEEIHHQNLTTAELHRPGGY